jgi:protein-tyrosine phosphatase
MLDLVNPDNAALHRAVSELEYLRTTHGSVLLHCALGLSRSALVAAAWLIQLDRDITVAQAIARVRAARPAVVFTAEHIELLKKWKTKRAA